MFIIFKYKTFILSELFYRRDIFRINIRKETFFVRLFQ